MRIKYIPLGAFVSIVGIIAVIVGTVLFDNAYNSVEPLLTTKHQLIDGQTIFPNQSINSTLFPDDLSEHNVIIAHVVPSSVPVKLLARDPNGDTFEKESKNGFLYHIIEKTTQTAGNYSIEIYNLGNSPVTASLLVGEDPFLSGKCGIGHGGECYAVPTAIGLVISGVITFIVGFILVINYLRKRRRRIT